MSVEDKVDKVKESVEKGVDAVDDSVDRVESYTQKNPRTALIIAVFISVVLGFVAGAIVV